MKLIVLILILKITSLVSPSYDGFTHLKAIEQKSSTQLG